VTQNEIRVGIVGADTKASWAKVSPSSTRPNSDRKERGYLPRVRQSESALDLVAGDLMSSPAVVAADTLSVREVARLVLEHGVGGVPVIDASGAAIGMVSDGDLMGRRSDGSRWDSWLRMLADGASSQEIFGRGGDRPVREVMSAPLIAVSPGAPVQDIAEALQAHRVKRLPVIDDGRVLGVVSRADLLCVVESVPKSRFKEEGGAGIPRFLESLIGGASLRGIVERRGGGPSEDSPELPKPHVFSASAFRNDVRAFKAERDDRKQAARREAKLGRRRQIKALLDHHVSAQLWRELLEHAELAARGGEQELMLLRFPSDLCIDGGRKIDVVEKGWEETLRGEAAEIYDRWRKEMKPQGFRLAARIVSYDDQGAIGDIGLYLTWGE
jgi:CBS domain-containing protein